MRYNVKINVVTKEGKEDTIWQQKTLKLPQKMVRWLLGDAVHVLVIKPEQSIKSVEFFETKEKE